MVTNRYIECYVDNDFIKHRKHIYYLIAEALPNCLVIIASYSIKTDRIILKDVSTYIPDAAMLQKFVRIAKERYTKLEKKISKNNQLQRNIK